MGDFRFLFESKVEKKAEELKNKVKVKRNNFIKIQELWSIFHDLQKKYKIDNHVVRKIYVNLIWCLDRFHPKHNWDACRLVGPGKIRTRRYKCRYRTDKHWSFPMPNIVTENSSEDCYYQRNELSSNWCPCCDLSDDKLDLLRLENLLELDPNYVIIKDE